MNRSQQKAACGVDEDGQGIRTVLELDPATTTCTTAEALRAWDGLMCLTTVELTAGASL